MDDTQAVGMKRMLDEAHFREPTLDEARAEFSTKMNAVLAAGSRMTETTDPEVFAFRARALTRACAELERVSFSVCHAAEKAASK